MCLALENLQLKLHKTIQALQEFNNIINNKKVLNLQMNLETSVHW